jgi:DNA-directed RNA polymerase subunit RPC12/RpoP
MCEAEKIMKEARFGKWVYYRNDEGKPRWKCSECGKIVHRLPIEKLYCSKCGAKMSLEA